MALENKSLKISGGGGGFFFFPPAQKAENLPHNIIFHSLRLKGTKIIP